MEVTVMPWRHVPGEASSHALLRSAARCYRDAFGYDRVWNAGWWCRPCSTPSSERRFNFAEQVSVCPDCGSPLEERWPMSVLVAKFTEELSCPQTVALVALRDGEVVAACTGLLMSASQLERYLSLPPSVSAQLFSVMSPDSRVVMQDLAFVHPQLQGQGLGRRMHAARHAMYEAHEPEWLVTRTARSPATAVYHWRVREEYRVLAAYNDSLDRVLLGKRFTPARDGQGRERPPAGF